MIDPRGPEMCYGPEKEEERRNNEALAPENNKILSKLLFHLGKKEEERSFSEGSVTPNTVSTEEEAEPELLIKQVVPVLKHQSDSGPALGFQGTTVLPLVADFPREPPSLGLLHGSLRAV